MFLFLFFYFFFFIFFFIFVSLQNYHVSVAIRLKQIKPWHLQKDSYTHIPHHIEISDGAFRDSDVAVTTDKSAIGSLAYSGSVKGDYASKPEDLIE